MNRREFITMLGGAALAWPLGALGQQAGKIYRIGFLANDPTIPAQPAGKAFVDGLRDSGFFEGRNISVERRFAEGRLDLYADLAAELVRLGADVIVVSSQPAIIAAKAATRTIPIVMVNALDPVAQGIVPSLAHPGGNITGLTQDDSAALATKRLQLLKDAIPTITRVAVLINPDLTYDRAQWQQLTSTAQSLKIILELVAIRQVGELESAFAKIKEGRPNALFLTTGNGLYFVHRRLVVDLATKYRLPVMSNWRETTEVGGLMSYGPSRTDLFRRAAVYTGKILKGARPGDLPIEQPVKHEFVINLKAARELNLEIPRDLLLVADEVIE